MTVGSAMAQNANAPGQDRVCLITFNTPAEAEAGADDTVVSTKYLPRKAAEAQAAKSGGKAKAFDYSDSTQTVAGVTYVITNNDEERDFCEKAFDRFRLTSCSARAWITPASR
ncbi:MAG: hypothetical protein BGO81_05030 [Devosia sp. 66-22]|nr:MAG: hypothetical protein BGO81_05030 [Devosia sp. 66-22]